MRLVRFFIKEYGVLRDLDIAFHHRDQGVASSSYSLDVIVGLNGSGKSTVLKAVAEVFRNLERSTPVPFVFALDYERMIAQVLTTVSVTNQKNPGDSSASELSVLIDGRRSQWRNDLLPDTIIAFTTGNQSLWNEARTPEERQTSQDLPTNWEDGEAYGWLSPLSTDRASLESQASKFRLIRSSELSLVTLCGLLGSISSEDQIAGSALKSVLAHAGIGKVVSFSLRFRVTSGMITPSELTTIETLGKLADRAISLGSDRLFVFDLGRDDGKCSKQILAAFSGALNLYKTLSNMFTASTELERSLRDISLFVAPQSEVETNAPLLLFEWLSDGEQSLVGRMCLLMLVRDKDGLVLLDEPEVHFNDYWKRRMLDFLDQVMHGQASHVVITTHSSITLTDLLKEDIIALQRSGAFTMDAANPTMSTFGADPAEVMVHLFSSEYATGQRAVSAILNALRERSPEEHVNQRQQLEDLLKDVSPGYWTYRIKAAMKRLKAE